MRKALLVAVAVLAVGYVAAGQRDGASSPLAAGSLAMVNSPQESAVLWSEREVNTRSDHYPPGVGVAVRVIADPTPRGWPKHDPFGVTPDPADRWIWLRVLEGPMEGKTGLMLRSELRPIPR
jgi:hypothetical protein